jgi:hypothetical protein
VGLRGNKYNKKIQKKINWTAKQKKLPTNHITYINKKSHGNDLQLFGTTEHSLPVHKL